MSDWAYSILGVKISTGEKQFFAERKFCEDEIPDYVCKTAACLAGHAIIASGKIVQIDRATEIPQIASKWLGFTLYEVDRLFYTGCWQPENLIRYERGNETERIIAALDQLDYVCEAADPVNTWKIHDHDAIRELTRSRDGFGF